MPPSGQRRVRENFIQKAAVSAGGGRDERVTFCDCLRYFFLVVSSTLNAQELTQEQKEVWKLVVKTSELWKAKNYKEYSNVYHENFTGWYPEDYFPLSKSEEANWDKHLMDSRDVKFEILRPMKIVVEGNIAIIQYYSSGMSTNKQSKEDKYSSIQWSDVWIKQNNEWKMLATHGTRMNP